MINRFLLRLEGLHGPFSVLLNRYPRLFSWEYSGRSVETSSPSSAEITHKSEASVDKQTVLLHTVSKSISFPADNIIHASLMVNYGGGGGESRINNSHCYRMLNRICVPRKQCWPSRWSICIHVWRCSREKDWSCYLLIYILSRTDHSFHWTRREILVLHAVKTTYIAPQQNKPVT
jgi:hypothetical protein